jgi:hypothetical protein
MNFLELLHELLLALCIAILLPVTIYWGVSSIYVNPNYNDFAIPINDDIKNELTEKANKKLQSENWQKARKVFDTYVFYSYLIVGLLAILVGSFISINGLAIGLVAGGFINICMSIAFNQGSAFFNFAIFLFLLLMIIALTIKKKQSKV